jgi:hypothetical protein
LKTENSKKPRLAEQLEFFDINGNVIGYKEWTKLFQDITYMRMARRVNGYIVMTSWTGVDQPNPAGLWQSHFSYNKWEPNDPPEIFRAAVWDQDMELVESHNFTTAREAKIMHHGLIDKYGTIDL